MPKAIPDCPPVPELRHRPKESRDYQIQLITPLFGGGVIGGEPDSLTPIRGTSIRGQLQFWWRATRGAVCAHRDELFARHREVWGTMDRASPVGIEVIWQGVPPTRVPCAEYTWDQRRRKGQGGWRLDWNAPFRGSALPYVLFPFQGKEPKGNQQQPQPEKDPAHFIKSGQFILRVRFPESLRQDVETAVWAWVNFGGIGARTRRGCGSLYCAELAPPSAVANELKTWFQQGAGTGERETREWPTLSSRLLCHPQSISLMDAWNQVIESLRQFRQGVPVARKPGSPAGQSLYPEPDSIRLITERSSPGHQADQDMAVGFPRAEFGLPIIFHFKDEKKGDPFDTVLYPFVGGEVRDRMASPLILKPLALGHGKAFPIALQLNSPSPQQVELQNARTSECLTPRHSVPVTDKSFARGNSPIAGRSSLGSATEAFWSFLTNSNGFTEVIR